MAMIMKMAMPTRQRVDTDILGLHRTEPRVDDEQQMEMEYPDFNAHLPSLLADARSLYVPLSDLVDVNGWQIRIVVDWRRKRGGEK